jgi:hypothetical protein
MQQLFDFHAKFRGTSAGISRNISKTSAHGPMNIQRWPRPCITEAERL